MIGLYQGFSTSVLLTFFLVSHLDKYLLWGLSVHYRMLTASLTFCWLDVNSTSPVVTKKKKNSARHPLCLLKTELHLVKNDGFRSGFSAVLLSLFYYLLFFFLDLIHRRPVFSTVSSLSDDGSHR